jgi:hypothetical protein
MSLKAMKWAIEVFLDRYSTADQVAEVIGALRKAIEQAEKPCQTGSQCIGGKCPECEREWVGLTDEEIEECKINGGLPHAINWRLSAKVLQAKLKEKNT